jgi:glycosyltransferase involved in cell wall biosynthesis
MSTETKAYRLVKLGTVVLPPNADAHKPHEISIVVPVYQGEKTLPSLIHEIIPLTSTVTTPDGHDYRVREVLLVFDNGPDEYETVIRALADTHPFVRAVWLSKNYGQHAATLAGMASAGGEWIVTLDEDGQHDPADIALMLDTAMGENASVVYAKPTNPPPHGFVRNAASRVAKWMLTKSAGGMSATNFQSYRLILGSIARSVAAYSGSGVYLDVAISWVANRVTTAPVKLRQEGDRPSGYSTRRLIEHFLRMILSSGTRGLRLVGFMGIIFALVGVAVAIYILIARLTNSAWPTGWASTIVISLLGTGAILFSLGVIAEYIGINVNMAMGKPPYLITTDPKFGPLGRNNAADPVKDSTLTQDKKYPVLDNRRS